jgi:hypothetical protein
VRIASAAALTGVFALGACASQPSQPAPGPAPQPTPTATTPPIAPPPRGNAVLYRPTPPVTYAYERRDSLTLQLPGGATQIQQFNRIAYLTVAVAEGAGAYQTSIRLDSLRQPAGGTVPPDSLTRAEGTRWTATLTPQGHLTGLQADRVTGIGDQIGASLVALFPALPQSGLQDASSWRDSTERPVKADAFDATERAITAYRMAGRDGQAYRIESNTVFQRTGTGGQSGGRPMEMASQGKRHALYRFGGDGTVLAAEGTDSAEMTITIPDVGQSVPVSQRATWRVFRR